MQGFKWLKLDENGKPFNHGTILQQITPERYLCQFAKLPSSCRVMRIEVIEGWHLFPNDQQMNAFIVDVIKRQPDTDPPVVKKKKAKKKATKK